jgi:hypothetical protein
MDDSSFPLKVSDIVAQELKYMYHPKCLTVFKGVMHFHREEDKNIEELVIAKLRKGYESFPVFGKYQPNSIER